MILASDQSPQVVQVGFFNDPARRPADTDRPRRAGKRLTLAAPPPDPFGEHRRARFHVRLQLLGGRFDFETDSARLLRIVRIAYAGLPPHILAAPAPRLRVQLVLTARPPGRARLRGEPPPVRPLAGAGMLCGAVGGANFVALSAPQRAALIVVSQDLLRYAYHIRYELLEFAIYVLAARVQGLVPLHAACVGRAGRGILLVGPSGAGKSTLVLQCLLDGLDFLAEDSVLVKPHDLRATGVANFLHLRPDSLRFLDAPGRAALLRSSATIRRRSGVAKLEIDLRREPYRLAAAPLRISAVVFLSSRPASADALLTPLLRSTALRRLAAQQRYASQQPGWSVFRRQLARLPMYQLRRAGHPREAVQALRALLTAAGGR
jgi:energy-coupling factor transporter ATP-binding protein EcfA2